MTLVQGSFSGASPPIHPRHPWGQQSSQQTSSFPRGNWWPYPWIPPTPFPIFVLWPHTSGSRTMSDEIFRLLPILILPVSHYKLLHSENGNRLRWRRGGTDRGKAKKGREEKGRGVEECASTTSPLRKILEERTTREIPTRNHISANILIWFTKPPL